MEEERNIEIRDIELVKDPPENSPGEMSPNKGPLVKRQKTNIERAEARRDDSEDPLPESIQEVEKDIIEREADLPPEERKAGAYAIHHVSLKGEGVAPLEEPTQHLTVIQLPKGDIPHSWETVALEPSENDNNTTTKLIVLFFAAELLYLFLCVLLPTIAGDEGGIDYPSHVIFSIYFVLRFIIAFVIKSKAQGLLKGAELRHLKPSIGCCTTVFSFILLFFAGTWPYFAMCFARIHGPKKAKTTYSFFGLFGLALLLHLFMLISFYRKLAPEKGLPFSQANLSKTRFLKLATYFAGLPPAYLALLPYRFYLREQQEVDGAGVADPSNAPPTATLFMVGRNLTLMVLGLMLALGAGLENMTELKVYGSLFVGAIGSAVVAEIALFAATMEPPNTEEATPIKRNIQA